MTRVPLFICLTSIVAAPLALEATLGTPLEALAWIGGFGALIALAHLLPQSGPLSFVPARSPTPGPGFGLPDNASLARLRLGRAFGALQIWATADSNVIDLGVHARARAAKSSDKIDLNIESRGRDAA